MRQTAVAGQFYPADPKHLKRELNRCFSHSTLNARDVIGAVVPHAGYIYSGITAAYVYNALPEAETYVFIGPNHTGLGSAVAVSLDNWKTPLGIIPSDVDFAKKLAGSIIDMDETAHRFEHSIEVQLPFLQYRFFHDFKIVPVCMSLQDQETAAEVGSLLAEAIKNSNKRVVIIASSDFSHYLPDKTARDTDAYLIESLLGQDVDEFYRRIARKAATACGYGPISAMLTASMALGASKGTLLTYATSADVTGDTSGVVGYAGIIFEK